MANGWARSIGRPGGNLTGLFLDAPELGGKEIQLLKEAVPGLSRIGILLDSSARLGCAGPRRVRGGAVGALV